MSKENFFMFFSEFSSSSLMELNKEEIPEMQNLFQSKENQEAASLGKRKINSVVKIEDEREVKRIALFSQEPLEEEENDIDMTEEDADTDDDQLDNNETIMEDAVIEEEYVVDFDGFF